MLNLQRVSGKMISGLGDDEIDFMSELTSRNTENIVYNQWTGLPEGEESFLSLLLNDSDLNFDLPDVDAMERLDLPEIDVETIEKLDTMEQAEVPLSTKSHTKAYSRKLKDFLSSRSLPNIIETMPVRYLDQYLRLWYSTLRKDDGSTALMPT